MAVRVLLVRKLPVLALSRARLGYFNQNYYCSIPSPRGAEKDDGGGDGIRRQQEQTVVDDLCRTLSDHRLPHHDLESALFPFAPHLTPSLVEHVLRRCSNLPLPSRRFFLWSSSSSPSFSHTHISHLTLLSSLARFRLFPLAWDHLRTRSPPTLFRPIFHILLDYYCRARLPSDAIRAFAAMEHQPFSLPHTMDDFHHLLRHLCRNSLMDAAVDTLNRLNLRLGPDVKAYTLVMKGWVDAGNPHQALHLFDEMPSTCPPDLVACNTHLSALCASGDLERAYSALSEMRSCRGLEPDAKTYSVLLRAHCNADDVRLADRVLQKMRRLGFVPNVFTYNCVVKLLCRAGDLEGAGEILDEMVENGLEPDIWSYNSIMVEHCKRREVNRGLKLLKRMYEEGFCLPDLHTYNMLLKMLIELGRFDRMEEVWDGMWKKGVHPSSSTYAIMIHRLSKKKGKLEEACKYLELMVEEGVPPQANTCQMLRDRLLKVGLVDNLHVIAGKMQRSTCCTIKELSDLMVVTRRRRSRVREDFQGEQYEWV